MLPKQHRVNTKNIDAIFKEGKFLVSLHLTFKFIKTNSLSPARISFISPKSVAKRAVDRNRLRRVGYTTVQNLIHSFPDGLIGAFVFKQYEEDISILTHEIKSILSKIN